MKVVSDKFSLYCFFFGTMYAAGNPGGHSRSDLLGKKFLPSGLPIDENVFIFSGDCTAIGMYIYLQI
jgi:hypothetical protein